MDFESLKEILRKGEIVKHEPRNKKKEAYDEANSYYTIPCTKDPFDGEVVQLNGEEFNVYFQKFNAGRDEYSFREKLHRMDEWLSTKPHKVQIKWETYIPKWLMKDF